MRGEGGKNGTALLESQSSGMSVCLLFVFCLFFKNSVSFQITDPLINLAEVEQGLLVLRNQHGRPSLESGRPVYQQPPPPPAVPWSALRPLAVCLPAGLPAWRRVKRLSWTWRMEPCTEWPVGYVERARGAWDPVICWLESSLGPGSCSLCSAAGSSPCPERYLAGAPVPSGG